MQTMTTSKGLSYRTLWASDAMTTRFAGLIVDDDRLLSEIAPEFEGLESIHVEDDDLGGKDFGAFPDLISIERNSAGVMFKLERSDTA